MTTALNVSRRLVRLAANEAEDEPLTPIRLHKLLYLCQGWYLAWTGKPLFPERIEAWKDGPVVTPIYSRPWGKGKDSVPDLGDPEDLSADALDAIDRVWAYYRKLSGWGLRDLTHKQPPWKEHFRPNEGGRGSETIPPTELAAFFAAEYKRMTGEDAQESPLPPGAIRTHEQVFQELGW